MSTILARTHVQLGLSSQQLLKIQQRLRFTMQHVYSHRGEFWKRMRGSCCCTGCFWHGVEPYLSTRWARHSFDSASCFATCPNIGDVLEKLRDITTEHIFCLPAPNQEIALCSTPCFKVVSFACTTFLLVISLSFAWLNFYSLHD